MMSDVQSLGGITGSLWSRIFIFVALGYVMGQAWPSRFRALIGRFVDFSIYGLVPVFVLVLMWGTSVSWNRFHKLSAAVLGVLAGSAALAWLLARTRRIPFRDVCLPVVFMNSIYLALPINIRLFGETGAAATVVFNLLVTLVHFTVGLWWVRQKNRDWWREVLGIPIVHAAFVGVLLNAAGISMPGPVKQFSNGLGTVVLPVMLVFVGIRTRERGLSGWREVAWGILLRMGGGVLLGWGLAVLLGLEGVERGVVIITASMPSAIHTYILAEKFDCRPAFAATMVAVGTAISALTVPLWGWLLLGW